MANMTLSIPEDLHAEMKEFPEINWSKVAQRAIREKMERERRFQKIEAIAQRSKLTRQDVEEIGQKIKRVAAERFREEASSWTQTS